MGISLHLLQLKYNNLYKDFPPVTDVIEDLNVMKNNTNTQSDVYRPRYEMTAKRILLVDDEDFILDTYSSLLSDRGYEVVTALSGREAFRKFSEQSCDLVITDLAMDDGDGFTLIVDIQEQSDDVPIIVFSGRKYKKGKEFVSLLGARGFIEKPCSGDTFITCVNSVLGRMT